MSKKNANEIIELFRQVIKKNQKLFAVLIFVIGLSLYALSVDKSSEPFWPFLGGLGTIIATSIAISFIYNVYLKEEERKLFLTDLKTTLNEEIDRLKKSPFHEKGRPPIEEKIKFMKEAKSEIIEIGIALRTLVGYFHQRPYSEFKFHVEELLRKGINFKFILLDPESPIANTYSLERQEPNMIDNIKNSINILTELKREFKENKLIGNFEIYLSCNFPSCNVTLIDPEDDSGRTFVSHYLFNIKRADSPVIEIHKRFYTTLFNKYYKFVENILSTSNKL